jgi:alkyl hydroperoxide reductase subunit D
MEATIGIAESLDTLFAPFGSVVGRETKMNLRRLLSESNLSAREAAPVLVSLAQSLNCERLLELGCAWMGQAGYSDSEIVEARESAALMAMLNTYYSFRQKVDNDDYGAAGLRMTALGKPQLGKVQFEMVAFSVSVLNGCQMCITNHERVLREAGLGTEKLHDLARLAAVVLATHRLFGTRS